MRSKTFLPCIPALLVLMSCQATGPDRRAIRIHGSDFHLDPSSMFQDSQLWTADFPLPESARVVRWSVRASSAPSRTAYSLYAIYPSRLGQRLGHIEAIHGWDYSLEIADSSNARDRTIRMHVSKPGVWTLKPAPDESGIAWSQLTYEVP